MQNLIPEDLLDILQRNGQDIETLGKVLTNDAVQVGAEFSWPASTSLLPYNYLPEDGRLLDRIGYAALFQQIGTTHGAGDGVTNFAIPDRTNAEFYIPALQTWTGLTGTYAANWQDNGGGTLAGAYTKDSKGFVYLRGCLHKTTAIAIANTPFTLPANFRPGGTIQGITIGNVSGVETWVGYGISNAGVYIINSAGQTPSGTSNYLFLDGVCFDSGVLPTPVATNGMITVIKVL